MARAGDQFSFSLIYLGNPDRFSPGGWGSILVFPDILALCGALSTRQAGDQFSFSLTYLLVNGKAEFTGWGSILVFPDILDLVELIVIVELGINSRFP